MFQATSFPVLHFLMVRDLCGALVNLAHLSKGMAKAVADTNSGSNQGVRYFFLCHAPLKQSPINSFQCDSLLIEFTRASPQMDLILPDSPTCMIVELV